MAAHPADCLPLTELTTDQLVDHFCGLSAKACWWVALRLTGADATQAKALALRKALLRRLHVDTGPETARSVDALNEAFSNCKEITDRIGTTPYQPTTGISPNPNQPGTTPQPAVSNLTLTL